MQTLFTMRGSKKAVKRREEWAKSQEDTLYRRGGGAKKTCSTPSVQMKKNLIELLFIEVKKKYPMESPAFHYPIEFGTSSCKGHSPE